MAYNSVKEKYFYVVSINPNKAYAETIWTTTMRVKKKDATAEAMRLEGFNGTWAQFKQKFKKDSGDKSYLYVRSLWVEFPE